MKTFDCTCGDIHASNCTRECTCPRGKPHLDVCRFASSHVQTPPGAGEFEQAAECWGKAQNIHHYAVAVPYRDEKLRTALQQAAAWERGAKAWERAGAAAIMRAETP